MKFLLLILSFLLISQSGFALDFCNGDGNSPDFSLVQVQVHKSNYQSSTIGHQGIPNQILEAVFSDFSATGFAQGLSIPTLNNPGSYAPICNNSPKSPANGCINPGTTNQHNLIPPWFKGSFTDANGVQQEYCKCGSNKPKNDPNLHIEVTFDASKISNLPSNFHPDFSNFALALFWDPGKQINANYIDSLKNYPTIKPADELVYSAQPNVIAFSANFGGAVFSRFKNVSQQGQTWIGEAGIKLFLKSDAILDRDLAGNVINDEITGWPIVHVFDRDLDDPNKKIVCLLTGKPVHFNLK